MDAAGIERVLIRLGCDKIRSGSTGWVHSSCPLARWKHPSGSDSNPSFSVSIEPNGASRYKCFACHARGELPQLIFTYARLSKQDLSGLLAEVAAANIPSDDEINARLKRSDDYWRPGAQKVAGVRVSATEAARVPVQVELKNLPESTLDAFQGLPAEVLAYLVGPERNLSLEAIASWELGWHRTMKRIAIPIRDCEGALVGISGRAFYDYQMPKYLHGSGFHRAYYLYGENRVRAGCHGYLCEGFFDVIYLHQFGYNAVAMMGSNLAAFQVEKLIKMFSSITIVPDGDVPGIKAAKEIHAVLSKRIWTNIADIPDGKDPDNLSLDELISILGPADQQPVLT